MGPEESQTGDHEPHTHTMVTGSKRPASNNADQCQVGIKRPRRADRDRVSSEQLSTGSSVPSSGKMSDCVKRTGHFYSMFACKMQFEAAQVEGTLKTTKGHKHAKAKRAV